MKCVECGASADYVFFGKSLCERHFRELESKAAEVEKNRKALEKEVN